MNFVDIVLSAGINKICVVGSMKWFPTKYLQNCSLETLDERFSIQLVERCAEDTSKVVGVLWSSREYRLLTHSELLSLSSNTREKITL